MLPFRELPRCMITIASEDTILPTFYSNSSNSGVILLNTPYTVGQVHCQSEYNAIPHPEKLAPTRMSRTGRTQCRAHFKDSAHKIQTNSYPSYTPCLTLKPAYHEWRSFW
jgi:hypothetical protein